VLNVAAKTEHKDRIEGLCSLATSITTKEVGVHQTIVSLFSLARPSVLFEVSPRFIMESQ